MTEERSCKTCALSSYNNVDKKTCGARGVSDCVYHNKWQPISKPKVQMTEREAREKLDRIIPWDLIESQNEEAFLSAFIGNLKDAGLISKSELVELVEEAEWMYENYQSAEYCLTTDEALEKNYQALQALKKDHPEFGVRR